MHRRLHENQQYTGNIMGIPVTYSGTLMRELRNMQEWDTVWTTGRQHGQTSHR